MTLASKGRILVVDDDRLVLATLSHGLAQAGYEVIDADNGDDAILLARAHRPDLALLDIRMQGLSGFDVAAYLREHERTPFMFLSAFSDEGTARQVAELGAVDWLVKPLDIGHILPAVAAALARLGAAAPPAQPASASPAAPSTALSAASSAEATGEVAMAVGVLMHRFSLRRAAALDRLGRLAAAASRSVDAQAAHVLSAIESMALPGDS